MPNKIMFDILLLILHELAQKALKIGEAKTHAKRDADFVKIQHVGILWSRASSVFSILRG